MNNRRNRFLQVKIMKYEEFYTQDWHLFAVKDIENSLNNFNLASNWLIENSLRQDQINQSDFIGRYNAAESIKTKPKGSKINYSERVYFLSAYLLK